MYKNLKGRKREGERKQRVQDQQEGMKNRKEEEEPWRTNPEMEARTMTGIKERRKE